MIAWLVGALGAAAASFAVLAVVFVPLERVFPARPSQRILRPGVVLDACFFVGQYLVFTAAALGVVGLVGGAVTSVVPSAFRAATASCPAWLQVMAAVMLGDFVVYWFHRACHRYDFLWRFHAVHHSSEHLDWLAAHREHPLDGIVTQLAMNLPAIALGVRIELLAGVAVFRGIWAIFVHSNVRLPLGPLRWLVGAPELHHWHHAKLAQHTTHNFANLAPWLDWLFGTHHLPEGEEGYALGIDDAAPPERRASPARYFAFIARPFVDG